MIENEVNVYQQETLIYLRRGQMALNEDVTNFGYFRITLNVEGGGTE